MKIFLHIIAVVAAMSFSFVAEATSPWYLGGRIGYWHSKNNGVSENQFLFAPEGGYTINKRVTIGFALGCNIENKSEQSTNTIVTLSPYVDYTMFRAGIFSFFVEGGVDVALCDASGFRIGLKPGISLSLNRHWSASSHVGFLGFSNKYYNTSGRGNGFGFRCNSTSVNLSLFYSF